MEGSVRSPLGFFGLAFPAACSGGHRARLLALSAGPCGGASLGGLLRLPRASRSDDFDSPNLCESVGGSIGSDAVGYNHYLKD